MARVLEFDLGTPPATGELVTLTVDGRSVIVPAGTSLMRAAALAGAEIPRLCATDTLAAFGSCRVCLVEIEGRPGTPASCTTPVAPGMAVRTRSEQLDRLRRNVVELYLSDHPADCDVEGECELHALAATLGVRESRYATGGATHLSLPCDESNPYFSFDPAKCIV